VALTKVETKSKAYVAPNPPAGASFWYHLQQAAKDVTITITGPDGKELSKLKGAGAAGLQRGLWDLNLGAGKAAPGEYTLQLTVDGERFTQKLRVEAAE